MQDKVAHNRLMAHRYVWTFSRPPRWLDSTSFPFSLLDIQRDWIPFLNLCVSFLSKWGFTWYIIWVWLEFICSNWGFHLIMVSFTQIMIWVWYMIWVWLEFICSNWGFPWYMICFYYWSWSDSFNNGHLIVYSYFSLVML